jgi:alanine racemase
MRATRVIVNLDRMRHNMATLRDMIGKNVQLCCVIKANAYGHGLVDMARFVQDEGTDRIAVNLLDEAAILRSNGIHCPLHVFGVCLPDEMQQAIDLQVIPFISSVDEAVRWNQAAKDMNKKLMVHIKIDIGMHRIGAMPCDTVTVRDTVLAQPYLVLDGVAGHFAVADDLDNKNHEQHLQYFSDTITSWRNAGIDIPVVHCANSAAILRGKDHHFDMVRPGIALYGYAPSVDMLWQSQVLQPALTWISRIVLLKKVKKGSAISYGGRYITSQDTWVATVPVGYADGYPRCMFGQAEVLVHGQRCPVIGTICMDQMMVDVSACPGVQLYDEVVLLGYENNAPTADDLAQWQGTINYEVLTNISSRVPRLYHQGVR